MKTIVIKKKKIYLTIDQLQNGQGFVFPLELELTTEDGNKVFKKVQINSKNQTFPLKVKGKITSIKLDPDCWLLFEAAE